MGLRSARLFPELLRRFAFDYSPDGSKSDSVMPIHTAWASSNRAGIWYAK